MDFICISWHYFLAKVQDYAYINSLHKIAEYCNVYDCMCVHPSICLSASIILQVGLGLHVQSSPNFCACYLCNIAVARSVLLWRSCDTLRTSGLWMTSYLLIMTRNIDVDVKRQTYYTHTRSSTDLTPRGVCSNWPTRGQHRIDQLRAWVWACRVFMYDCLVLIEAETTISALRLRPKPHRPIGLAGHAYSTRPIATARSALYLSQIGLNFYLHYVM